MGNYFGKWLRAKALRSGITPVELSRFYAPSTFYTWHRRPKIPLQTASHGAPDLSSLAVIVQGPFIEKNEFTAQTCIFYKRLLGTGLVILSTWQGVPRAQRKSLEANGIVVIENSRPENTGLRNINLQICSTASGLKFAKESGIPSAIKTRSDQRIYNPAAFPLMLNSLSSFKAHQDGHARLGAVSLNTFATRKFGLSDMLQFSSTEELLLFWEGEEEFPTYPRVPADFVGPEAYLTKRYLDRFYERIVKDTLREWHSALARRFVILDAASIDLFWPKYSRREHLWRRYEADAKLVELDFAQWFNLYSFENQSGI